MQISLCVETGKMECNSDIILTKLENGGQRNECCSCRMLHSN